MIFLFIIVPLVLASLMPLLGKISKRFLPDLLANADHALPAGSLGHLAPSR